jgi:hypothetical protein
VTGLRRFAAPLAIYGVTRLFAVVLVMAAAPARVVRLESLPGYHAAGPAVSPPDYASVMTSWDGQWYWDIAVNGYPTTVLAQDGRPAQTSLAFFPLFPLLVRAVMAVSGTGFAVAAPATSIVLGAAAVVLVYRLVERCIDRRRALVVVALLCTFTTAPILQAAYTESLALLLVALILLLLREQRYAWALLPVLLLGLTRNIAIVLAPVVALHWAWQVRASRRDRPRRADDGPRVRHGQLGLLLTATLVATALWPLLAGIITGTPDAYLATLSAWPGFSGSVLASPLAGMLASSPTLLTITVAALLGAALTLWLLPGRRRWGPELTGWAISYPLYIFAVSSATFSVARYLLLAFPLALLWAPDTESDTQRRRQHLVVGVLAVSGLALQWVWVTKVLVFAGPTGGWGYP